MSLKGSILTLISCLFFTLTGTPSYADHHATDWLHGMIRMESSKFAFFENVRTLDGEHEMIAKIVIDMYFEPDDGKTPDVKLGHLALEIRTPLFGYVDENPAENERINKEIAQIKDPKERATAEKNRRTYLERLAEDRISSIENAKFFTLHQLVEFEEGGMNLAKLPSGMHLNGHESAVNLGARGQQFLKILSEHGLNDEAKNEEQKFESLELEFSGNEFDDWGEVAKKETPQSKKQGYKIQNRSRVGIQFDQKDHSKVISVDFWSPDPDEVIFIPEDISILRGFEKINLNETKLETIRRNLVKLAENVEVEGKTFYMQNRISLITEQLTLKLQQFYDTKYNDMLIRQANAEKNIVVKADSKNPAPELSAGDLYWKNDTHVIQLGRILSELKKMRQKMLTELCVNRLVSFK